MKTVLCLPGTWGDREEFRAACGRAGLAAAGAFIVDTLSGAHLEVDFQPRDERMREAFAASSGGEVEGAELEAIGEHRSVVYLLGDGGDLEKLRPMVQIAVRLLPYGALGIKVESAGVSAPIERWMELSVRFDPFGLIRCFVVAATTEDGAYSCGMHNLGLPDVEIAGVPPAEASKTLDQFNLYQLVEHPSLKDGQTFAREQGARAFRLKKLACTRFPEDDPFHNPFGVWHLQST